MRGDFPTADFVSQDCSRCNDTVLLEEEMTNAVSEKVKNKDPMMGC
jgi:hypothetical protein